MFLESRIELSFFCCLTVKTKFFTLQKLKPKAVINNKQMNLKVLSS